MFYLVCYQFNDNNKTKNIVPSSVYKCFVQGMRIIFQERKDCRYDLFVVILDFTVTFVNYLDYVTRLLKHIEQSFGSSLV